MVWATFWATFYQTLMVTWSDQAEVQLTLVNAVSVQQSFAGSQQTSAARFSPKFTFVNFFG
jgi:hypothetical protein